MQPLRNGEHLAGMGPGTVEDKHDLLLLTRPYCLREVLQGQGKDVSRDGGQEQPLGTSCCWMDKGIDVEPTFSDAAPPQLDVAY